jgi:hypothetical protein
VWVALELELREQGLPAEPVAVLDSAGRLLPETRDVLDVIARHRMVLATGHLGRDEIFTVVQAAAAAGVAHIVVTHPEFPSQSLSIADQVALAEQGALLERCFTTAYTGKARWETLFAASRAVGAEHTIFSSDLGQTFNPPVEDGLALMVDQFLADGFDEQQVRTMAVVNPRIVAGEDPVGDQNRAQAAGDRA